MSDIERTARIADFRKVGAEFGVNIARCVLQSIVDGIRDPALQRDYVFGVLLPAKADELRILGATDRQIATYTKSASKTARLALGKIASAVIPNRHMRRAERRASG
jgi:hypothetical protein